MTCATPVRRGRKLTEKCKRDHLLTPDNVRIDPKTGRRKGCRACSRMRSALCRAERNSPVGVQRKPEAEQSKADEEANAEWFDWVAVYRAATGAKAVGRELYPLEIKALIRCTMALSATELSTRAGVWVGTIIEWRSKYSEPVNATKDAAKEPNLLAGTFTLSAVAPILPGYVPVFATLAPAAGGVGVEPAVA